MSKPRILEGPAFNSEYESHESYHSFILDNARKHSERIWMIEHSSGQRFTYGKYLKDVLRLANGLKSHGFSTKDVFLVYGHNSYEYLVCYLAGLTVGGIAVAVRGKDTVFEVIQQIKVREVKWLFIQDELFEVYAQVCKECPCVKVFSFDDTGYNIEGAKDDGDYLGTILELLQSEDPLKDEDIFEPFNSKETPAVILESSGTTGPAKGSFLSHYSLRMIFSGPKKFTESTKEDIFVYSSPMAHLSAIVMLGVSTKNGAKTVLLRESNLETMVEVIRKYKVSNACFTPSDINVMSNWSKTCDLSSVQRVFTGGAKIVPSSVANFIARYNPKEVLNCYGMTETGGIVCEVDFCQSEKLGINLDCVGKAGYGVQLKVIDVKTGELLPPNKPGELCIRTRFRFLKYHKDPERTKATLDEEDWIHSGDVAYYDQKDYVYIVDRIKDMIDQNGFHFSSADIEEVLMEHPDVTDTCAIGIPQPEGGDIAYAFVIKKEDSQITEDELKRFVNERVSKFKQIKGDVHFVSEFPKTSYGKVKRNQLRDSFNNIYKF